MIIYYKTCGRCKKYFCTSLPKIQHCSTICYEGKEIRKYRRLCKFKIDPTIYPDMFDNELLRNHGWFRARAKGGRIDSNVNGATWDHLLRIEDGFKLGIDPSIMSHPANAEMVSWAVNIRRKKSMITYDELLKRIEEFDKKIG